MTLHSHCLSTFWIRPCNHSHHYFLWLTISSFCHPNFVFGAMQKFACSSHAHEPQFFPFSMNSGLHEARENHKEIRCITNGTNCHQSTPKHHQPSFVPWFCTQLMLSICVGVGDHSQKNHIFFILLQICSKFILLSDPIYRILKSCLVFPNFGHTSGAIVSTPPPHR